MPRKQRVVDHIVERLASVAVDLDRAISDGQAKAGDVVLMAALAHAGDFAGAAAVRWGARG
ncbi:hypothetical protein AWC11_24535 [Mycobacterium interjectum]|jgi:3-oxoacyl-[acyl-carrier-protein] synthase-3|nr:hypothetical protein AWC11_24535 [Mycobacterium interjectum]